jgi:GTP-binding protein EngB required for normal cell division
VQSTSRVSRLAANFQGSFMKNKQKGIPEALTKALPGSIRNLERLELLMNDVGLPKIAVYGKYNHGKSSLLNALVGEEIFNVADKRETLNVSEFECDGIVWIDTPGLDAAPKGEDDRKAHEAARLKADILCLVHSADAGELDSSEVELFKSLIRRDNNYRQKILLVLTNTDRKEVEEVEQILTLIRSEFPDLTILGTAAKHYNQWVRDGKTALVKRSGIAEVKSYLEQLKAGVGELRRKEALRLVRNARLELSDLINDKEMALAGAEDKQKKFRGKFWKDLEAARAKISDRFKALDAN